jgi:hypothetical protein
MSEHKVMPTGMAKNPIVRIKTSMMTATGSIRALPSFCRYFIIKAFLQKL